MMIRPFVPHSRSEPKRIVIDKDAYIYHIVWYELKGEKAIADALRLLATHATPPYHVDEARVQEEITFLQGE